MPDPLSSALQGLFQSASDRWSSPHITMRLLLRALYTQETSSRESDCQHQSLLPSQRIAFGLPTIIEDNAKVNCKTWSWDFPPPVFRAMVFTLGNHSCGDLTCPALFRANVPLSQQRLNGGKREWFPDSGAVTPKILRRAEGTRRQSSDPFISMSQSNNSKQIHFHSSSGRSYRDP